jgi:hypothetical protein
MSTTLKPFDNDSQVTVIAGELTVENGTDVVTLSGSLELTKDKAGLANAKTLQALIGAVIAQMEAETNLPEKLIRKDNLQGYTSNPFGT